MTPDDEKDPVMSEKEREMAKSMNPLKTNFGIDISIPRPLWGLVSGIVFMYFLTIRFTVLSLVGLVIFIVSYPVSVLIKCLYFSNETFKYCLVNDSLQLYLVGVNFVFAIATVAFLLMLDYKMDWEKFFFG